MTRACGFFNGSGAIYESGEARPGPFPAPTINCGRAGGLMKKCGKAVLGFSEKQGKASN